MNAHKKWLWSGLAAGLLYALIAYAPASWLASGIAAASSGQVLLAAPRGTVWDGSADVVLSGGEGSSGAVRLPGAMHWHIAPKWLGFDVQLAALCCTPTASPVLLGLRADPFVDKLNVAWHFDALSLQLPAELLAGLGAPWNTLQLMGELSLSSDKLAGVWSRAEGLTNITGRASVQASHVATALSTVRPLGSYRLSSTGAVMRLETLASAPAEAALILSGTGRIEQGRISFLGEAQAASGREEALSNLLHIVGQWQPSTDGRSRSILKL